MHQLIADEGDFLIGRLFQIGRETSDGWQGFSDVKATAEGGTGIVTQLLHRFGESGDAFEIFKRSRL